jgi:hypothetical protein
VWVDRHHSHFSDLSVLGLVWLDRQTSAEWHQQPILCPVSRDFPGVAVALPLLPQAYVVLQDQRLMIVYPFLMPKVKVYPPQVSSSMALGT